MKRIKWGLLLGAVAGVIDVILMVIQKLSWDANLSAFTFWVIVGLIISISDIKLKGTLKGVVLSLILIVPLAIIIGWQNPLTLVPIIIMNIILGSGLGYLIDRRKYASLDDRQSKEKKDYWANVFSVLALVVSVSSLVWSGYIFYKTLPLQESDLTIDNFDPQEVEDCKNFKINGPCIILEPVIKNLGRTEAKNIKISINLLPLLIDSDFNLYVVTGTKMFDEAELLNNIGPDSSFKFGKIFFPVVNGATLFYIKIENSDLFNDEKIKEFWIKYNHGERQIYSLLKSERDEYKKYFDDLNK